MSATCGIDQISPAASHSTATSADAARDQIPCSHDSPVAPVDVPALVEIIEELAEYERTRSEVQIDEAMLETALFGNEPSVFARVAVDTDDHIIGMALYYRSFSTWSGKPGIYREDLYVRPANRNSGVGRNLLSALAQIAIDSDCRRLEWSVLDWNESAIAFYRSIGAVAMDEWTRYRLAGPALVDFARSSSSAN